ncbi:MAG: Resolvase, terminal domain [Clostridiales bacterium]|jgi:DNA invertase Pin-like site-specific DNA recombinase|nr:Resolvase, terminal domain [Clostridiales bacterium]
MQGSRYEEGKQWKAVIYLRVDQLDIEDKEKSYLKLQAYLAEQHAKDMGIRMEELLVFREYYDGSYSETVFEVEGVDLCTRPALAKIIEMALNREFKYLIVLSRDRITRNIKAFFSIKELLKEVGIKIHYTQSDQQFY